LSLSTTISSWLRQSDAAPFIRGGRRGLEKESLRVDAAGRLSRKPHPKALGAALTHPHLTTDYSEALLEIVTPPLASNWESLQFLCDMHGFVHRRLDSEQLWPSSMPGLLDAEQTIPIAEYGSSNPGRVKTIYRHGLGRRYGRTMQAIAGVHFNYSLQPEFWRHWQRERAEQLTDADFRSAGYMGLVRNFRRLAWLTIYLFGASPACGKSFEPRGHPGLEAFDRDTWYGPYATSLRMSDLGYRNGDHARWTISANSLADYLAGMRAALTTPDPAFAAMGVNVDGEYRQLNSNVLQIENEYYSAVRPKPPKTSKQRPLLALQSGGVEYVEVRTLDLSVGDPVGVNQAELRFLETLLIYCLLTDSPAITTTEQAEIAERELRVALHGRRPGLQLPVAGAERGLRDWGLRLMDELGVVAAALDADGEDYAAAVAAQRSALEEPDRTPSARFVAAMAEHGGGFYDYVLRLAAEQRDYFLRLPVDAEHEAALERIASDSLAAAEALERATTMSLDDYLATEINTLS
jgi:glutamate--cysteine ligase